MSFSEDLYESIERAITSDQMTLPTLPEVALRIREVVENPNASAKDLSKEIGMDAALSARIIRIANSPLLRGSVRVDDLQLAITRLGIGYVQNIATGLAMEQIFQATNEFVDKRLRESWEHSKEVAGISGILAKNFTKLSSDKATLAGLVHEIGILPILTYAEDHPELFDDEEKLEQVINEIHPRIGTIILKTWDFPEELISVIENYLNFERASNSSSDYTDIVTVANLHSYHGIEHELNNLDWHTVTAFERLGIDPDLNLHEDERLHDELTDMKEILN